MNDKKIKIGIFDSGLGGLTVFKSLSKLYKSNASFIYLGDLAHLPYGDKSKESIIRYSHKIVDFFISQYVDIIIVACNSASSVALKELQNNYDIPIIGTIKPSVQQAMDKFNAQSIGVIGTETTINSKAYNTEFKNYKGYQIYSVSCPLFVPIVEEGWENTDVAHQIATKYLSNFSDIKLDTIILACTHYPMLINTLRTVFEKLGHKNLNFIDSGDAISNHLATNLSITSDNPSSSLINLNNQFYITDTSYQFNELANRFLGENIANIQLISL